MFLGTYEYTADSKGRLFIPAKLREGKASKGEKFILTKGMEGCLYIYGSQTFQKTVLSRLENISVKNQRDARAFKRLLLAGAQEVETDEMGRILLPRLLMDFAKIKKNVTILGVGERIELWSTPRWNDYNKKAGSTFQRMGKDLEI